MLGNRLPRFSVSSSLLERFTVGLDFLWDSHQTKIIELKTTIDQRNHVFICDSPQKNKTIQSKTKGPGFL